MYKRLRNAEELQRRKELKLLFKKVVRQVIINTLWLDEHNEDERTRYRFSQTAGKNLLLLVRTKRKSGMLRANEKSLLRTPSYLRTIDDRRKLCTLFIGLKCFSSIPPKIRARLVPVIKLMSINSGRMVMREGDNPLTVIFIVTGEIVMSKTKARTMSNQFISERDILFGPGDCIGDLEMTEECPRIHTFITRSPCELLALFKDDFDTILKPYMKKVWIDKKKAIKALDYFDFLDEEQILNACKMCTLKEFKPLDIIYSHDKGTLTNVHFILSGECVILQCLHMKVRKIGNKKVYKLVDTVEESRLSDGSDLDVKIKENNVQPTLIFNFSSEDEQNEQEKQNMQFGRMKLKDIELACGQRTKSLDTSTIIHSSNETNSLIRYDEETKLSINEYQEEHEETPSSSISSLVKCNQNVVEEFDMSTILNAEDSEESTDSISQASLYPFAPTVIKETYESHFIDVGSLTFGGIFGLGEKTKNRLIMARNTVQCLMLPRIFLLDNNLNPGRIWQRRLFNLNCIIPTREILFKDFLQNLKWKKFKSEYINENLKEIACNIASYDDIPIMCRIEAGLK